MNAEQNTSLIDAIIRSASSTIEQGSANSRYFRLAKSTVKVTANSELLLDNYLASLNHLDCAPRFHDFQILLLSSQFSQAPHHLIDRLSESIGLLRCLEIESPEHLLMSAMDDRNSFCAANLSRKIAVCWLGNEALIPERIPARPLRNLFHWFMAPLGYQLLHSGAVGDELGAVLLVGPSACGKSTTTLSLLGSGMNYLGDDFVMVGPSTGKDGISIFNLYSWARIRELPALLTKEKGCLQSLLSYENKLTVPLAAMFGQQIKAELPLRAVICPHVGPQTGALEAISTIGAFRHFVPSLGYLPGHERLTISHISAYLSRLPCYSLQVGQDIEKAGILIKDLLQSLA